MKKILLIVTVLTFIITACTPATNPPTVTQLGEVNTVEPPTSQSGDSVPLPSDSNLARSIVFLDSTELVTQESYPVQFTLVLKGGLPTPCHKLRVAVSPPNSQNKVDVDVYSVVDPNEICAQMVEPFEENFPLGSFPTGRYTLWVNGKQIAEFEA